MKLVPHPTDIHNEAQLGYEIRRSLQSLDAMTPDATGLELLGSSASTVSLRPTDPIPGVFPNKAALLANYFEHVDGVYSIEDIASRRLKSTNS
jgi:hypothetical protein